MLTIRPDSIPDPSAAADTAEPTAPEAPQQAEPAKKPIPMVWIPATLGLGLLIAIAYLGGRIVTAKAHSTPAVRPVAAAPKTPAAAPPLVAVATETPKPSPLVETKPAPPSQPVAEKPSPLVKPSPVPEPKPAVAAATPVSETKPVAVVVTPLAETTSAPPVAEELADLPTIQPQPGQRYIQIGALVPRATRRYLNTLDQAKLDPHVAPGPTPDLVRVLVGPFHDRDSLAAVQSQLDAQGVQNFIRQY